MPAPPDPPRPELLRARSSRLRYRQFREDYYAMVLRQMQATAEGAEDPAWK